MQLRLKTKNELNKMIITDLLDYKTTVGLNQIRYNVNNGLMTMDDAKALLFVVTNEIDLRDDDNKRVNLREFFSSL